jgi:hypothetical protein
MTTITAAAPNPHVIAPRLLNPDSSGPLSWIRTVYNLFQDDNPLIVKVVTAAAAAFATLGVGYLLGSTFLFTSMMATIVVLAGYMESKDIQNEATIQAQKREIANFEAFDLLLGQHVIDMAFQVLDLGDRESATGAIDFLQPNEVRTPKRGVDKYGRRFFALPLRKISDLSRHLLVLHEKHVSGDAWEVVAPQDLFRGTLTPEGRARLAYLGSPQGNGTYKITNL